MKNFQMFKLDLEKAKESEIYKQGVKTVFRMGENNSK